MTGRGIVGQIRDLYQKLYWAQLIIKNDYMWKDLINAVLGLAVIGALFLGLDAATLSWTLGILGAVIAVIGVWGALSSIPEESSSVSRSHA